MATISTLINAYRGIRVVVLGASGFIGRRVAHALCAQGARLYLVVRSKEVARDVFVRQIADENIVESDLRDTKSINTLFQKIRPDITFNLAGYGVDRTQRDESMAYQINAELVKAICEAIAKIRDAEWPGQDIIHVGTALEYGAIGGNLAEHSVPHPTTVYGQSKLAGTRLLAECCESFGINGLTARLFTVYGPGEHQSRLLPTLIDAAKTEKPLPLTMGKQKRDFTYVEDVADGLLRLGLVTAAAPGEIVNLATGKLTTVRRFAKAAAEILEMPAGNLTFGIIPTRDEEMEHAEVSTIRLRQLVNWVPPTSIADGICKTINWKSRPSNSTIFQGVL